MSTNEPVVQDVSAQAYTPIPGCAASTSKLVAYLRANAVPGKEFTDAELSEVAGFSTAVGGDAYSNLLTAQRILCREHALVLVRQRGQGLIRCVDADGTIDVVRVDRSRARRAAKRGQERLCTIDLDALEGDKQQHALVLGAQLGAIAMLGSRQAAAKLASVTANDSPDLGSLVSGTLAAFRQRQLE